MDLAAAALPVSLLKPLPSASAAATSLPGADEATKRARIAKTAGDYESSFISIMLGQMFEGVETTTFGGGQGEAAFKSFLTDAMAKSMTRHGGVGLSKSLAGEMLKMQGLAPQPTTAANAKTAAEPLQ